MSFTRTILIFSLAISISGRHLGLFAAVYEHKSLRTKYSSYKREKSIIDILNVLGGLHCSAVQYILINHLVINQLLNPSQYTLPLEARSKLKVNDWIQISNQNQNLDDSEISCEILTKLGINFGKLGALKVGAPPLLLSSPPPRHGMPPNSSLNDDSGLSPTEYENSGHSPLPDNENSNSDFLNPVNENSRPLLPSENENLDPLFLY